MNATTAALLQVSTGAVIAGVSLAFIAYVTGTDRLIVQAVTHPLRTFEIAFAAIILSTLPKPRKGTYRKHYKGRHAK